MTDDLIAANQLAVLLHLAGGGALSTPSSSVSGSTVDANQLGQNAIDAATHRAATTTNVPTSETTTTGGVATPGAAVADDGSIVDPVPEGTGVSQGYGGGTGHPGIDLAVPLDTQLLAAQSGTVTQAENDDPNGTHNNDFGNIVTITTPDGHQIRYGHLHSMSVHVGDTVKAGQVIGTSGGDKGGPTSGNSDGPHLHFEVRGPDGNTVDPTPWLAGGHRIVSADPSQVSTQVSTTTTHNPPSEDAAMGATIGNILDVAAGKPATHQAQGTTTTSTTTKKGADGSTVPAGATGSDGDPGAVDAFLAATRQHESGGNYQIYNTSGQSNASGAYQFIGTTWRGMGGSTPNAADASPEEQDAIARKMAMQLFDQFHSWRLVAIAWYGGPAVAQQVANGQDPGSPEGQGPYLAYGDTIVSMMQGGA